jgi:putative FmdB family regulatory protein
MPTYDYHCKACDHDFSRTESLAAHERARVTCPRCHSTSVERTLTPFYAKTGRKS